MSLQANNYINWKSKLLAAFEKVENELIWYNAEFTHGDSCVIDVHRWRQMNPYPKADCV